MTKLLILIYILSISFGLPDSVLGSLWPQMYTDLNTGVSVAGYISMTVPAATILSSLLAHRVVRRFGVGKVTAVSILLTALALAGFALSPHVGLMFLFAIPLGLGAGAVDVAQNNFVALHYQVRHMNWLHCFWGIGASAGPMIAAFALNMGTSWRGGFGTVAGLQTLLTIVMFCGIPMWSRAGSKEQTLQEKKEPLKFTQLFRFGGILPVLGGFLLYSGLEATAGLWGATFIHSRFAVTDAQAAVTASIYFGALTLGRMMAGFLSARFSDQQMIRMGLGCSVVGMVLILTAGTQVQALLGIAVMGMGFAPVYPAMLHTTPTYFGAENSQQVMGLEMALSYVGSTCFPPLLGILTQAFGAEVYPVFLLSCGVLAIFFTELTRRHFRIRKK